MSGIVFRAEGVVRREIRVDEASDAERATAVVTLVMARRSRAVRVVGLQDLRWFGEVGGDEFRIVDLNRRDGNMLEFGRYQVEWWYGWGLLAAFTADGFEVLG